MLNGSTSLQFIKKAAQYDLNIINVLVRNHMGYKRLQKYLEYFFSRYDMRVKNAFKKKGIFQCKPCTKTSLYPNLAFNEARMDKYRTVDDELESQPSVPFNGPDGYDIMYPDLFNENSGASSESSFCLSQLSGAPEQAFCM